MGRFYFYTNYDSKKERLFKKIIRLVFTFCTRFRKADYHKADLEKVAENLSDGYFSSRPRGSQLGAAVSPQSSVIPNREYLEDKLAALEKNTKEKKFLDLKLGDSSQTLSDRVLARKT